ncbi:MAG: biotin transporter BioY [Acidobacteria bacterium]|nr:biotin transporter BioY [Acidobacteriota bacterium]
MTRSSSSVLVDQLSPSHAAARDVLAVVGFALLTALLAQLRVDLPYSPVPLTGQTFAVLLAGAVLGLRRGFASQAVYLALGAMGMPVFAGGLGGPVILVGPTAGYLWSFPLAAGLLGWLVERGASRALWKLAPALFVADILILASGTVWLSILSGQPTRVVLQWGVVPFIVSNVVKVAAVGLTLPRLLKNSRAGEIS